MKSQPIGGVRQEDDPTHVVGEVEAQERTNISAADGQVQKSAESSREQGRGKEKPVRRANKLYNLRKS